MQVVLTHVLTMSATVNVICFKGKVLKNSESPLMIRITKDRKSRYLSIGVSLNPNHWDFVKNKPKRNCPNREQILTLIEEREREYRDKILDYKIANKDFTITTLIEKASNPQKQKTVKDVFDLYVQNLQSANRLQYAEMFKVTERSLIRFNGHLDIPFFDCVLYPLIHSRLLRFSQSHLSLL